jgi:hypothetical protein
MRGAQLRTEAKTALRVASAEKALITQVDGTLRAIDARVRARLARISSASRPRNGRKSKQALPPLAAAQSRSATLRDVHASRLIAGMLLALAACASEPVPQQAHTPVPTLPVQRSTAAAMASSNSNAANLGPYS